MHELAMLVLLQQCGDAFVQQNHSVGEHGDRIHGEKFQSFEKKNFLIFTTPVSLHCKNFGVQFSLNKIFKIREDLKHFRSFLKKIDPSKLAKIINKAYII